MIRGGRTLLQLRPLIKKFVKSLLGTFSRVLRVIFELGIPDLPGDLTFSLAYQLTMKDSVLASF